MPRDRRCMHEDEISEDEIDDILFWAGLEGIRDVEIKTIREWIERDGYAIDPNPANTELPAMLAVLLDRLFSIGVVVESTDHLSDRELYEWLLQHLSGHMALLPNSFLHLDVIGSGSEEDNELYLRYYATDEERALWQERFPEYALPPHEAPPYPR
jgi:N-dimethylarginine dimethylaminohydrolase